MDLEKVISTLEEAVKKLDDKTIIDTTVFESLKAGLDNQKREYEATVAKLKEVEEKLKAATDELNELKAQEAKRKMDERKTQLVNLGINEEYAVKLLDLEDAQFTALIEAIKNIKTKEVPKVDMASIKEIEEIQKKMDKNINDEMILETPDIKKQIKKIFSR